MKRTKSPKWTIKITEKYLNTSCTLVKSWFNHYGETGNIDDRPGIWGESRDI